MNPTQEFRELLQSTDLDSDQIERVVEFREEVLREEEMQNLTRLLSPKDFFEGHVQDVLELEKSGLLAGSAIDMGAGMGVPGLLHQLVFPRPAPQGAEFAWVSSDSERMKADFAQRMIEKFDIPAMTAISERAETYLASHSIDNVVARAVGPVTRIYNWLRTCSTWNNLMLFKGPRWEEEWAEFQKTGQRSQLSVLTTHDYVVGDEKKQRKIILLRRVS